MTEIKETIQHKVDHIVKDIEERIYTGKLKEGERLPPEREIETEFDVSRTVVREAIKILSTKGLIEARPNFRPVIKSPNYDTAFNMVTSIVEHFISKKEGAKNLYDIRTLIEASLVRIATVRATKDDIAKLRVALQTNFKEIKNSEKFFETDMAFHRVLYTIPDNPLLLSIHQSFCDWLGVYWRKIPRDINYNKNICEAHEKIFEGILNRDVDEAEQALITHLDRSWQEFFKVVGDLHSSK